MKKILVLGVGKSATYLFEYLSEKSKIHNWLILACDIDEKAIKEKTAHLVNIIPKSLDVHDVNQLTELIETCDIVVSMLPAAMHPEIAKICVSSKKHLATASYVSPEIMAFDAEAKRLGLVLLNEMGLDPGIDHMSAMQLLDNLKAEGAEVVFFESYCGGLVHQDDCLDNPWQYKFSWNPRNVILAGQGGMSVYKKDNMLRYLPWHRVFSESRSLDLGVYGSFDAYPNRDSLSYVGTYGLENASTFLRGTLRRKNFCKGWQVLVELGFTDDKTILHSSICSPFLLTQALTGFNGNDFGNWLLENGYISANLKLHFQFLELESKSNTLVLDAPTAAGKLQQWLTQKWKLSPYDRDEVVMHHRMGYTKNGQMNWTTSTLNLQGTDSIHTAMAKAVGLPLAMGVELILNNQINEFGVQIPVSKVWYEPVLYMLEKLGISFVESHN
jgi:saccharopine dehydrogenase-like NADP-dependent oxidoreductase